MSISIRPEQDELFLSGIFGAGTHSSCMSDAIHRLKNLNDPPQEVYISGASVTDLIHNSTMQLLDVVASGKCRKLSIVVKSPDEAWASATHKGMCFVPPYSHMDSLNMLNQSIEDLKKLSAMCKPYRKVKIEFGQTEWPSTYTFVLMKYENYYWGFIEPFLFGVPVSDRIVFKLLEDIEADSHGYLNVLLASHSSLVKDSSRIINEN